MTELHTTAPEKQDVPARELSRDDLEVIELQVRDRLLTTDSVESARELASELLVSVGQEPLAENETRRVMLMNIDGEPVEQTIVVDPEDFGTAVRSISEMGIEGFVDEEASNEVEPAEQLERELGEVAIEGAEAEDAEDSDAETEASGEPETDLALDELLTGSSWNTIGDIAGQLQNRTRAVVQQLDEMNMLLSRINYDGGNTAAYGSQLMQSLESLNGLVRGSSLDGDLAEQTRIIRGKAEEVVGDVLRKESSTDDDRYKARKIEEAVEEMSTIGRVVADEYEQFRTTMHPHGRFMQNVEELMRTPRGYETTISVLHSMITEASDTMSMATGRLSRIEASLEDVARARKA